MTKHLVISDIHQDDRALQSLLKSAKDYDAIWCLGDVAGHKDQLEKKYAGEGYTGDVLACYQMLREINAKCIIGNWEGWLLQQERDNDETAYQHPYASELAEIRDVLKGTDILDWIKCWETSMYLDNLFTLVHGSIDNNGNDKAKMWETYIRPKRPGVKQDVKNHDDIELIHNIFWRKKLNTPHMLHGHTHIPGHFIWNRNLPEWYGPDLDYEYPYNYRNRTSHYIVNPGSLSLNRVSNGSAFERDLQGTALVIDTHKHVFYYISVPKETS